MQPNNAMKNVHSFENWTLKVSRWTLNHSSGLSSLCSIRQIAQPLNKISTRMAAKVFKDENLSIILQNEDPIGPNTIDKF